MKKLLGIVVLGLLLSSNVYSGSYWECTTGNFKGLTIFCETGEVFDTQKCSCTGVKIDNNSWKKKDEAKKKAKLDKFNSKKNKEFGIIFIILLVLIFAFIKFRKKFDSRISKLTKLDKGMFRAWIVLSVLWFFGSLFYLITNDIFFFHYDGFQQGNTYFGYDNSPFDAFFAISIICVLPPFLIVIIWLIIKWIYKGFK